MLTILNYPQNDCELPEGRIYEYLELIECMAEAEASRSDWYWVGMAKIIATEARYQN